MQPRTPGGGPDHDGSPKVSGSPSAPAESPGDPQAGAFSLNLGAKAAILKLKEASVSHAPPSGEGVTGCIPDEVPADGFFE